ncbi:YitT family protein [Oceanobacillus sp. J11TS1]|uniref:YitT family protein n=1 Tax=Oceanobacillus sp. J11TS1 TaxID=2807191 RepID=UPI001B0EFD59|nr:YitT family protein [Oceanobacillus sp. J11TS1]GIO24089.1 membrane protein [Oceanobacillus sp. J11TS1]
MKNYVFLVTGTFFFAVSVAIFAMPNSLAEGGVPGLALLMYHGLAISPALTTLLANAITLLIGYRYLPTDMIIKSIVTIPLFSFFIYMMEDFGAAIPDPLLAAIFAGVFTGVGFGFIFRSGSTTGGTSTIARMLNYKFGWELTGTNFVLDVSVVIAGIFVIGPLYTMYTVLALFIGKRVTDYVLEGFESKSVVHIFSSKTEEVENAIQTSLGTHTTVLKAEKNPDGIEENLIYVAIPRQRLFYLKKLVQSIDENAFTVVHTVKDVTGGSFAEAHHPGQKTFRNRRMEQRYYKKQADEESYTLTDNASVNNNK